MYICKYCGRYLKNNYDNCPGCGSNSFEHINKSGVIKITNVPEGGYKINIANLKKDNIGGIILIIMGVMFCIIPVISMLISLAFITFSHRALFSGVGIVMFFGQGIFALIGVFLLVLGINMTKNHRQKINKVQELTQHGVLIKNLPYTVKPSGTVINGQEIYCIEVMYEYENGTKIPLKSEGKYDGRLSRGDGTVDLLIDPNDTNNYFIDFEIY